MGDTSDVSEVAKGITKANLEADLTPALADAVTTNANLTGHVTSTGNAAVLGSFTAAQLSTAISDATLSGNNTGDEAASSLTVAGVVEIATPTEVNTGTDDTRAVSPVGLTAWTGDTAIVTTGTIATGTWQGTAINQTYLAGQSGTNTGDEVAASATTAGVVELTTDVEYTTGTDTTRATTAANAKVELDKKLNRSPLITSAASYTTDTGTSLNVDTCDEFVVTAQAGALLFNAPSGTPTQGQKLMIRIKDNATGRALTYNAIFRVIGVTLPTTTVASKTHYIGAVYNSTDVKWDILAVGAEA